MDLGRRSMDWKDGETAGPQADAWRQHELNPKSSYWGEQETKEWRRKLREERERVEGEQRREKLEWRIWESQQREFLESRGRWGNPPPQGV